MKFGEASSTVDKPDELMSIVVLAEKPSVAEDIAKVLGISKKEATHWQGDGVVVTWAVGHMLELKYVDDYDPEFKNWRKTADRLPYIPEEFEFKPKSGSTKKQLTAIKKLMKDKSVSEIVNACDAAREGELIFQTIYHHAKIKTNVSRMWLQSMTSSAIQKAWDERKASDEFKPLSDAAYSRSQADWLIGMNGSRVAEIFLRTKRKGHQAISIGRVQTATLGIIVDHELQVLQHIPTPYWELNATFTNKTSTWSGRWEGGVSNDDVKSHWVLTQKDKDRIQNLLDSGVDAEVTEKLSLGKERPPLNYDLTSLQRQANSMFSWPAKRTLNIAQALYERHKLTTYPRTDSRYLPTDMNDAIDETIANIGSQSDYSTFSVTSKKLDSKISREISMMPK